MAEVEVDQAQVQLLAMLVLLARQVADQAAELPLLAGVDLLDKATTVARVQVVPIAVEAVVEAQALSGAMVC
jgi:hypothetical protein